MKNERSADAKLQTSKQVILVVSLGAVESQARESSIGEIERKIKLSFPAYDVKRAFTSRHVISRIQTREGIAVDSVTDAMERLSGENYDTVIIQPTHIIDGCEYEELIRLCAPYEDQFKAIRYGKPLLTSVADYEDVVRAVAGEIPEMQAEDTAVIFVGHGTRHRANAAYSALASRFHANGYNHTFVGTIKGHPNIDDVRKKVSESGVEKIVIFPLTLAAGGHAANDICGEAEGSWYTAFQKDGYAVTSVLKGLGEYEGIQEIFAAHIRAAIADE